MEKRDYWQLVTKDAWFCVAVIVAVAFLAAGCESSSGKGTQFILSDSNPHSEATNVERTIVPILSFSKNLDAASVVAGTVTLSTSSGLLSISLSVSGNKVTVSPVSDLEPLTSYTLVANKSIRAADGSQLDAAITLTFSTQDRTWKPMQLVGSAPLGFDVSGYYFNVGNVGLTILESGVAWASWIQEDESSNDQIFGNTYGVQGGWDQPFVIQSSGHTVSNRELTNDSNGNSIAMWQVDFGADPTQTWLDLYRPGRGWTGAVLVNNERGGINGITPDVRAVVNATGDAFVVWAQNGVSQPNIWAAHFIEGIGWTGAQVINSGETGSSYPQVAIDRNGNALVIWEQDFRIKSSWYSTTVGWHTPVTVDDGAATFAGEGQIAADGYGGAIAVWRQTVSFSGLERTDEIWGSRFVDEQGWGPPEQLSSPDLAAFMPRVAVNASGAAIAAWLSSDNVNFHQCSVRIFQPGTGWDAIANVGESHLYAHDVTVAMDQAGGALTICTQTEQAGSGPFGIWANRFTSEGQWGLLHKLASQMNDYPRVAFEPDGSAMAVWGMFDGAQMGIWSSRFD